jgi:hypothetical protein
MISTRKPCIDVFFNHKTYGMYIFKAALLNRKIPYFQRNSCKGWMETDYLKLDDLLTT